VIFQLHQQPAGIWPRGGRVSCRKTPGHPQVIRSLLVTAVMICKTVPCDRRMRKIR